MKKIYSLVLAALLGSGAAMAQIVVRAGVDHVKPDGKDSLGNIVLNISGGAAPYSYSWNKGLYPVGKDRGNELKNAFSVKVKDAGSDSVICYYNLGYKIQWSGYDGTISRNDTLMKTGGSTSGGSPRAQSINTLRPNTDGWVEVVLCPLEDNYIVGFLDSVSVTGPGNHYDLDFAFHITAGDALYAWDGGSFSFLGNAYAGDVIRLERSGAEYYLYKNNVRLYSKSANAKKNNFIKALIAGDVLVNMGASFADSISTDRLRAYARMDHVAAGGMDMEGAIKPEVHGGATPYTYRWAPDVSDTKDLAHAEPGLYSLVIKDFNQDSVEYQYHLGYKAGWGNLHSAQQRNDSLMSDGSSLEPGINRSARTTNVLKKNTNGWVEWIVQPNSHTGHVMGFLDSAYVSTPLTHDDMDFAYYILDGVYLYAYTSTSFYYIGTVEVGDAIRIGRNSSEFYLEKNMVSLFTWPSPLYSKSLTVKTLFVDDAVVNVGCSFGPPLSIDYSSAGGSAEDPGSGYIYLTPKGGKPPYTYLWSDHSTENQLSGLSQGTYSVKVTDAASDSLTLSFTIGPEVHWTNQQNLSQNGENELLKTEWDKSAMANTSTYIDAGTGGYYEFKLKDLNTNFNFVFTPYDTLTGLIAEKPIVVRQSTVSIARSSLPTPGSPEYSTINFADTITTGTHANVIQKEFVSDTCTADCERLELQGIQFDYGMLYSLRNGVTIKKGAAIDNNSILRFSLSGDVFGSYKDGHPLFVESVTAAGTFGGHITVSGPKVSSGPVNGNGPVSNGTFEGCYTCSNDTYRNFSEQIAYDDQGVIVAQSRTYFDNLGRPQQAQVKNISAHNILASQVLYDAYGRQVGGSLPAPINDFCFCYKTNFITNSSNTAYGYNDFDVPNHTSNPGSVVSGERDWPKAVGTSAPGTLGWYYSNNNTLEKYVPAAEIPYSRIEYSSVDPSSVYKAAKPGKFLSNGSGHEAYTFKMATMGELNHLFGAGLGWRVDQFSNFYDPNPCSDIIRPLPLLNTSPVSSKIISRDENGNETVTFTDLTGNVIASCLSGKVNGSNVKTQTMQSWLSFTEEENRYLDIHLPDGCENSLSISYPGGTPAVYPVFNFIDLKTNEFVKFSGGSIDFTGSQPNLPPGSYRIMVKTLPACAGLVCMAGVNIVQNLNYYNVALYYYDYANRLKAAVQPKNFADGYEFEGTPQHQNQNRGVRVITSGANTPAYFEDGTTWSLNGSSFVSSFSLGLPPVGRDTSASLSLRITFSDRQAPYLGEMPGHPSSDERSADANTSQGDYLRQNYDGQRDTVKIPEDTVVISSAEVCFRVKIALLNAAGDTIRGSVRETKDLKCTIRQTATEVYRSWSPVVFNYNQTLVNSGTISVAPDWQQLKILVLEPAYAALGTHDPSQYNDLADSIHITVNASRLIGNLRPEHKMAERYRYNSWGELESTVSPDEGRSDFVYSLDGRLKFSQNSKQDASDPSAANRSYTFINYDAAGRPVESGEHVPTLISGTPFFQSYEEESASPSWSSVFVWLEDDGIALQSPNLAAYSRDMVKLIYDSFDPAFYAETGLSQSTYVQRHLTGKVSCSYNENRRAWYSYDEQGRIEWVVQKYYGVNAPGAGADLVKTYVYTYDYGGNVTQVAYNTASSADRFYHYYEYDQDQRLKRTYTSRNGLSKTLNAKYDFYLHGPLKRIELANKMQGLDFVYTINGWLKAMNGPEMDQDHDSGKDGCLASTAASNTTYKDIFGLNLDYFYEDYERDGTHVQSYTDSQNMTPFSPDLFNGIVKGERWQTRTPAGFTGLSYPNQHLMYGYRYDKKYQLTQASFATITGNGNQNLPSPNNPPALYGLTTGIQTDYRVSNLTYDNNGNILTLKRDAYAAGPNGINLDNLVYSYASCSNRLTRVEDGVSGNPFNNLGFKPGQATNNYQYNALGELTGNSNDNKQYEYNSLGNVTAVKDGSGNLKATYVYDEMGYRIRKVTDLGGGSVKVTWYVRDAGGQIVSTYEKTGTLYTASQLPTGPTTTSGSNFGIPAEWNLPGGSRLGVLDNTGGTETYIYELGDQLGNVRATFKKKIKTSLYSDFDGNGPDDNWFNDNGTLTAELDMNGLDFMSKTQKPAKPFGAGSRPIPVKNGDNITIDWRSVYLTAPAPNAGMVIQLTDAAGNILPGCWQYFPVTGGAQMLMPNQFVYAITANYPDMYLVMYPWNQDNSGKPAYFDGYNITFNSGGVEEPDQLTMATYYPHGSVMPGMNYNNSYAYKYGYQGQFAEKDEESNENFFELRNYEPLLGRFQTTDPYRQFWSPYLAMGNSHPNMVDPDGGNAYTALVGAGIGAIFGAGVGMVVDYGKDGKLNQGFGFYAAWVSGGAFVGAAFAGFGWDKPTGRYSLVNQGWKSNWHGGIPDGATESIFVLIKSGHKDLSTQDWGKLDGHFFLNIDGADYSFRPTMNRNGKVLSEGSSNYLWHSDGWVGSDPGYYNHGLSVAHSMYEIKVTPGQKSNLLKNIQKSKLSPPDYRTLGTRCAGWGMKMLLRSKIVGPSSLFYRWSPFPSGNYLNRQRNVTRLN